ncbi:A24 family peptidase [Vibrio sp. FNV 38]|nr:A24 family peptidase [Vibrio sp. FNV 38]
MFLTQSLIWGLLFVIGFYDAKENRIPNWSVLALAIIGLIYNALLTGGWESSLIALLCGVVTFCLALVFFFLKVMAPGDVKLMGAVGCFVGWSGLGGSIMWIAISSVLVGTFYFCYFHSIDTFKAGGPTLSASSLSNSPTVSKTLSNDRLSMPFAPIVVIGLALGSYFS